MAYYPPPGQYPPPQQPYYPQPPDNTDTVAMILEIVFGLFGIMGMGWLYAGNILTAVLVFIGFMIFVLVEAALIALTGGLCSCVALPVNIGLAVFSAIRARDYVRRTRSRGSVMYVIIAGIIGRSTMAATTRSATLLSDKTNAVNNAIWADADCYLSTTCSITGDFQMVEGGIHSNAELKIAPSGEGSAYTGTLEYAAPDHYVQLDKIELYPAPSITNPVQVPVDFLEPLFDINDYDYRVEGSKIPTPTIVGEGYLFDGVDYYFYPDNGGGTNPQMVMAEGGMIAIVIGY